MKMPIAVLAALVAGAAAAPASATTVVVYSDPMTLEWRTVVIDSDGPDRAFLCTLPPGQAGCHPLPIKRVRR
jgi:hypothetical protein